jgi:hypothetical protein
MLDNRRETLEEYHADTVSRVFKDLSLATASFPLQCEQRKHFPDAKWAIRFGNRRDGTLLTSITERNSNSTLDSRYSISSMFPQYCRSALDPIVSTTTSSPAFGLFSKEIPLVHLKRENNAYKGIHDDVLDTLTELWHKVKLMKSRIIPDDTLAPDMSKHPRRYTIEGQIVEEQVKGKQPSRTCIGTLKNQPLQSRRKRSGGSWPHKTTEPMKRHYARALFRTCFCQ